MSNQNQLAILHDIAMEFVDEALFAQKRGDEATAQLFCQKAYNLERTYALSIPKEESYQLSRSIFLRSAATLALDCQKPSEANELATLALEDNPHPAIVGELEEVLARSLEHSLSRDFGKSTIERNLIPPSKIPIQTRQIQLTIEDEKEADLLMALLGKFDSVRVQIMEDNNKDFWDELSEERKQNIEKAMKEVEEGKTIPHAEVQKRIRESILQAEKDIEEGKVYTVEKAREMMRKKRKK